MKPDLSEGLVGLIIVGVLALVFAITFGDIGQKPIQVPRQVESPIKPPTQEIPTLKDSLSTEPVPKNFMGHPDSTNVQVHEGTTTFYLYVYPQAA